MYLVAADNWGIFLSGIRERNKGLSKISFMTWGVLLAAALGAGLFSVLMPIEVKTSVNPTVVTTTTEPTLKPPANLPKVSSRTSGVVSGGS